MATYVRDPSKVRSPGGVGAARAAIARPALGTAAVVAGVLLVAGPASARPRAGELAAHSTASLSIAVSVRPRFDVRREALEADGPGAVIVRSNFGHRFSIRREQDAFRAPREGPRTAVFIIVPD